jgi:hypothetical protein
MRQVAPQKSNTSNTAMMNSNVGEGLSPSIARGAIYLGDFWEEHIRPEIAAPRIEDTPVNWQETQVHWQGMRHVLGPSGYYVLGPSGYYVPDSSRARRYMGGKYKQGKEGVATGYEGFLELPPPVVVLVMWVAGVALLGLCALVLYWVGRVVIGLMAGSI